MPPNNTENGWNEWGRHVLSELKRLNEWVGEVDKKQTTILMQLSALKVKAGVWGLIAGAIPVAIGLVIWFIKAQT
jgi:hypothetical protein